MVNVYTGMMMGPWFRLRHRGREVLYLCMSQCMLVYICMYMCMCGVDYAVHDGRYLPGTWRLCVCVCVLI
jgi:hypothetical protein